MSKRLSPIARQGLLLGAAAVLAFLMHAAWAFGANALAYALLAAFAGVMLLCLRAG